MIYDLGEQRPINLPEGVFVAPSAAIIGDVTLLPDSSIWFGAVLRGDIERITIGRGSNIQDGSVCHTDPNNPCSVGDYVTVGHMAMLHGCSIGSRVLVGMGSIVMDGAVVEDEVIIGAGSLVPAKRTLESGYLYMGSPAKQVRPLTDREREFFTYSAANYVRLKDQHLLENWASS